MQKMPFLTKKRMKFKKIRKTKNLSRKKNKMQKLKILALKFPKIWKAEKKMKLKPVKI